MCRGLGIIPQVSEVPKNKVPQKRGRGKAVKGEPIGAEITEYLKTHSTRATVTKYKGKVCRSTIYKIDKEEKDKETISKDKETTLRLGLRAIYELVGLDLDKKVEFVALDNRWIEIRDPQEPKPKKGKLIFRTVIDSWNMEAYGVELVYRGKGQLCTLDSVMEEELHRAKGNARKSLE